MIEVKKPKLIKGPIIPVLINLKKLNLIFLDFSINNRYFTHIKLITYTTQEKLI